MVSRAGNRLGGNVCVWRGVLSLGARASLVEITPDPSPQPTQLSVLADTEVPEHDTSLDHTAASSFSFRLAFKGEPG